MLPRSPKLETGQIYSVSHSRPRVNHAKGINFSSQRGGGGVLIGTPGHISPCLVVLLVAKLNPTGTGPFFF